MSDGILVLGASDVEAALSGLEVAVLHAVRDAYRLHAQRMTIVPHSSFVPLPGGDGRRIIALPAYVGTEIERVGIKWIASFPDNLQRGLERASAVIVLNSMMTGYPEVIMEGSRISAARTAASAAVAARALRPGEAWREVGLVGCGVINFHVLRYLLSAGIALEHVVVHDLDAERANRFAADCERAFAQLRVSVAPDLDTLLSGQLLVSLATTATQPHIESLDECRAGALVLHLSLRDIVPRAIARCDNVVDDVDHVCRANTSLHLAELLLGDRDFIRTSVGEILLGEAAARVDETSVTVYSPFGLGALDIAVAALVSDAAAAEHAGTRIDGFSARSG
jgi:2,3-diaminopropionate biosynthesis protein SbnB